MYSGFDHSGTYGGNLFIFISISVASALAAAAAAALHQIDLRTIPRPWDAIVTQVYCDIPRAGDDEIIAHATIVNPSVSPVLATVSVQRASRSMRERFTRAGTPVRMKVAWRAGRRRYIVARRTSVNIVPPFGAVHLSTAFSATHERSRLVVLVGQHDGRLRGFSMPLTGRL